jgi:hypothetical protein
VKSHNITHWQRATWEDKWRAASYFLMKGNEMVKFKISFTIDAKTLFAYLSQALPTLENLNVEEIFEKSQIIEKKQITEKELISSATDKQIKRRKKKIVERQFRIDFGLNKIIVDFLSDGKPHGHSELELIDVKEYSQSSIGSRLAALKEYGVIWQPDYGEYQLTEKYMKNK